MSNNKVLEKVIAVGVVLPDQSRHIAEEHLDELQKLIETAGGVVAARIVAKREAPDPAAWIGSGKAEELKRLAAARSASGVGVGDGLPPPHARHLQRTT